MLARVLVLGCAALTSLTSVAAAPPRVERVHSGVVATGDEPLVQRFHEGADDDVLRLSGRDAEDDLDELEWSLEHGYAYRGRTDFDAPRALDSIRVRVGHSIRIDDFSLQLAMLMARFRDGHAVVHDVDRVMPPGTLGFVAVDTADGVVAVTDGAVFDATSPLLYAIDDVEIEQWIDAARVLAPAPTPQYERSVALRRLTFAPFLRARLGRRPNWFVSAELRGPNGAKRAISTRLSPAAPAAGDGRTTAEMLEGDIAYVRMPTFDSGVDPDHAITMVKGLHRLREAHGLVIDVRGNGGGSRWALMTLAPFFMAADEAPRVASVAAYRRGERLAEDHLWHRYMYEGDSFMWTEPKLRAVEAFAPTFEPEWTPPDREAGFSAWHYLVLGAEDNTDSFPWTTPAVVLMDGGGLGATEVLLGAMKGVPNVTMMGTPSGGGSGAPVPVRLRNSNVVVLIPSMVSYRPDGRLYDGRGIEPDIVVQQRAADLAAGRDTQLEAARAHIRKLTE